MNTNFNPYKLDRVLSKLDFIGFPDAQKETVQNTINEWISYLYGSPNANNGSNTARGVFNKLVDLDKDLKIVDSTNSANRPFHRARFSRECQFCCSFIQSIRVPESEFECRSCKVSG